MRRHIKKKATRKLVTPKTLEEYYALTGEEQDLWNRIPHVVTKMRSEDASLPVASREFELDPVAVVQLAGSALRKNASGHYEAKPSDRLLRVLIVLTDEGIQEIAIRDSREASWIATHWNAVQQYVETGDASDLSAFERMRITDANGSEVSLLTNLQEIDRLGSAGLLSFESLYAGAAR